MNRVRATSIALCALFVSAFAGAGQASASGPNLGPDPTVCNAYAPVVNCFYEAVSGTDTFTMGGHLLHVGDTVSGIYKWSIGGQGGGEFPSVGSVTVGDAGPGLKLLSCHGPHSASNAKAKWRTPKAFDVTEGHTTCTWRAKSATPWTTTMGLAVYAGGGTYTAGDFYAVLAKGSVIEGTVREENTDGELADDTGVKDAKVRVSGPHGFRKTVATSGIGYYHVFVPQPGTYTVTPEIPKSYWKGSRPKAAEPSFRKVHVPDNKTVKANFVVKSTLRLTLKLDHSSVPADGLSYVTATVKATDGGEPKPNMIFSLRPYGGGSALKSAWEMPVPATICPVTGTAVGTRVWPKPYVSKPNTASVDVTTDANGESTFRVYTGTVPGSFPLTVWAENSSGHLITKEVSNISADEDIRVQPLGGGGEPTQALVNYLNKPGNEGVAGSLPTYNADIVTALSEAIHAHGLGGFVLAPVQTSTSGVDVLIAPAGTRLNIDPATGYISPSNPGQIIAPSALIGGSLGGGGFWGLVKTHTAAMFPSIGQWLANSAPGYAFPGNAAPIYLTPGFGPLRYLNFGYGTDCN